ncbi:MAG: HDOD domain-containing protein [Phycisphaerae bacterium]
MGSAIYETIKASRDLPSPTGVALKVLELAQREESTAGQIAAVVETDPALASRLLKLVNSSHSGLTRPIASIQRAVALLGNRTVTNLALGFSLVSNHRSGRCERFEYEAFWSESLGRAVAARHLADCYTGLAPDDVFAVGLLCQIGRLALATAFPGRYAEVLEASPGGEPAVLSAVELSEFGINHNELAQEMMSDWRLPDAYCRATRTQDAPDKVGEECEAQVAPLARILHLSGAVAGLLTVGEASRLMDLETMLGSLNAPVEEFGPLFEVVAREWAAAAAILSVRSRRVPSLSEIYAAARACQASLEKGRVSPLTGCQER